ncbi:MAG: MYG1 family protein [Candidatus Paceibacterota bacterium]|jgi:uncharacterized UPF0160 family protein
MEIKNKIKIITHNGSFHADEIFTCATLSIFFEQEGKEFDILRTRDETAIKSGFNNQDIFLVDVGWINNPDKNLFDHHQIEGAGERQNGIPFASFGLVWKKFGERVCGSKEISDELDKKLVQSIDAFDSGIKLSEDIKKDVHSYDLGNLIDAFLPSWKEDRNIQDGTFLKIVEVAKILIQREISKTKDNFEGEKFVEEIYKNTEDKRIIVLDKGYPRDPVLSKHKEPLFVVFPKDADNKWQILTIRDDSNSFVNRKDLPKSWGGLTGEELAQVSGVPDALFCHKNLFIATANSKEGAIKLAQIALES